MVLVLMEVEEAAEVEVVVEASPKLEEGEVGQAREDILKEVEEAEEAEDKHEGRRRRRRRTSMRGGGGIGV